MFQKLLLLFKIRELRNKIIFVLFLLSIFRLASTIPVPGVDVERLRSFFAGNQFLGLLNLFSGGALSNLSIIMLGVGPYITSSIIMQLLTMIFPAFKEMYHEAGEQGRQKFNQYSRILTVPLAIVQAFSFIKLLQSNQIILQISQFQMLTNILLITAGTVFIMWIGELISEKGIGNGISLIIFAGIVAKIPEVLRQAILTFDVSQIPMLVSFVAMTIAVIAGVVMITEAQRNIPVSYAKKIRGNRVYGGATTYLPLRINQAGVIPIIFALSIMLFPGMISSFLSATSIAWLSNFAASVSGIFQNQLFYGILYFILVVIFTFFYTAITFDPKAISENIQKQGGFITGIRPGKSTADFLYYILNRITLAGALFLGLIAVMPFLVQWGMGLSTTMTIGGTALLIAVSVVLETSKQIDSQLVMRDYEGFR
ncbi:MAG: preprotein translocase subunit SecY [Parcubacteria group bacterium GW2011_GWA2_38_13b]|nr:MAG: preprotein translocase subunit SecY [Parcubacteria group bacterium GW2011_GWA2_38_13b]